MPIAPGAALVTGGARRLGRAMAEALVADGWSVAIHANASTGDADALAAELTARGGTVAVVRADLMNEMEVEALVPAAAAALGAPLSLLVNNASIFEPDAIGGLTRRSWDRAIETNLRAPVTLTQAFAAQAPQAVPDETPGMEGLPLPRACVVNMIDQRVWKPVPDFLSYGIAKAGLWSFTQMAAQALAPHVRVCGIGPGPTMRGIRQSEEHFAAQRASTLLERGAGPADIIGGLRYILAADGFTGQMLALDGGQHLAWKTPDATLPE
ncbi:SDR family oxidoreductase [Rhodovulum sp. DZ06]|uniref:SDR family oxidoreductase n=1 Tax=Rhodovulum sp. DZ06 TaxID=3425126 RepID=UPI003D330DA8